MLNTVTQRMQHFCSHLRTTKKCWMMLKTFDGNQTSFNIVQHRATWWPNECDMLDYIQQCWMMLHQHFGSVWPGLNTCGCPQRTLVEHRLPTSSCVCEGSNNPRVPFFFSPSQASPGRELFIFWALSNKIIPITISSYNYGIH